MASYLVAYDLLKDRSAHDYRPLGAELRRLGGHKTQLSLWLVAFSNSARELHDHLQGFVDGEDRLWVTEIVRNKYYTNAMPGTNDWLKQNPPAR